MGESNTIDFETFMKQTGESKFDAKQYVEAERQKAKEIAQAQTQKKLKEQRDEHSPENTLEKKTKDAVQATESQIQYAESVSYTHLRSPRDATLSRMPSSA